MSDETNLPSDYTYSAISTCATTRQWCQASCTVSTYTGAADGLSSIYGSAGGTPLPTGVPVAQSGVTYYLYNEVSWPAATSEIVRMRTWLENGTVISTGDYIRIAYLAETYASGGTLPDNTLWL